MVWCFIATAIDVVHVGNIQKYSDAIWDNNIAWKEELQAELTQHIV